MWATEDSPDPKAAYRGGWYHFTTGYTQLLKQQPIRGCWCLILNNIEQRSLLLYGTCYVIPHMRNLCL